MKPFHTLIALACCASLFACEPDKSTTLQDSLTADNTSDVFSDLDFATSTIPFPNNLLFAGTLDGTLNIPLAGDPSDAPLIALNALDGFSTTAPITTGFSGALDDTSLATAMRVFEATFLASPGVITSVDAELTYGVDFVATQTVASDGSSTLAILPLKPLKPKQAYMVAVTNDLRSASGKRVGISGSYSLTHGSNPLEVGGVSTRPDLFDDATAVQLEQIRQATLAAEGQLTAFDSTVSGSDLILSWNFTTQSVGDVLTVVRGLVGTPASTITASTVDLDGPGTALSPGDSPAGQATMYEGTVDLPYYLTAATGVNDAAVLDSVWTAVNPAFMGDTEKNVTTYNPLPAVTSTQSVPVLISIPKTGSKPYKTIIFQHGITTDRTKMLAVADTFAAAGFATVAIDLPLHGVDSTSPYYSSGNERTFDLDLVNNTTGATGPDGNTDASGTNFINLVNLLNTRDNNRQATADLFALRAALGSMDVDGAGGADDLSTAAGDVHFVGHSLGAMVGTAFLALETGIEDAVLVFGGGGLPKILDGSASFGPTISAGLAANGVFKGTAEYETFLGAAQTATDSGDPLNYGVAAAANHDILFMEIAGGAGSPSDLTVPNTVPDGNDTSGTVPSLLAGTEPLVGPAIMNMTPTNTDGASGDLLVRFTAGHHGSLLTADNTTGNANVVSSAEVNAEILSQIASYLASTTATVNITDNSVIAAP